MDQRTDDGHAEVEDEILLDKQDGIADEASAESTSDINFSITSYGADYPVDTLVKRMKGEVFFIPNFQRNSFGHNDMPHGLLNHSSWGYLFLAYFSTKRLIRVSI